MVRDSDFILNLLSICWMVLNREGMPFDLHFRRLKLAFYVKPKSENGRLLQGCFSYSGNKLWLFEFELRQ